MAWWVCGRADQYATVGEREHVQIKKQSQSFPAFFMPFAGFLMLNPWRSSCL